MQTQIRRVGIALTVAFLLVFLQLNYLQFWGAEAIAQKPGNSRALLREYSIRRGDIVTGDDVTVATSRETRGTFKYERTYPGGELYGHITGFYSLVFGATRIESSYNEELLGENDVISMQDIRDSLLESGEEGDNVRLTINSRVQEVAREALGDQTGAVVALDPNTGAVRAMWSNPSFDPTPLASHDPQVVRATMDRLRSQSPNPLFPIATSKGYPPGSTFKVVTAAAALESARYDASSRFPDPAELELPQTDETLTNFTKQPCTSEGRIDLFTALTVSCDTTFAMIGLEMPGEVLEMANALGFNDPIPFDVATQPSLAPEVPDDEAPFRAFAGIGQGNVQATPLQMALVAATVANDGVVPRPRLVDEIIGRNADVVESIPPETLGRAMSTDTANTLTDMMVSVVSDESGTGTAARMPGIEVAAKTGTAQSVEGAAPHAWFISFAPAEDPQIAVAVIVENGGSLGSEATGGQVAAPISKAVIEADRDVRGW
jgi:peptidoglycan glycosyltransferase